MHFRQRVAWLLLAVYLTATAAVVYYMFEINTQLRIFALDHVDRMHTVAASPLRPAVADYAKPSVVSTPSIVLSYATFFWSMLGHVVDIPLPVIAVLLFILYVQVGCFFFTVSIYTDAEQCLNYKGLERVQPPHSCGVTPLDYDSCFLLSSVGANICHFVREIC